MNRERSIPQNVSGDQLAEREFPFEPPAIWFGTPPDCPPQYESGCWIEANQSIESIREQLDQAISERPAAHRDVDWQLRDHHGFAPWQPDLETVSVEMLAAVAQGISEHGKGFAAWVEAKGCTSPGELARYQAGEVAFYGSYIEFAYELWLTLGYNIDIPGLPDGIGEFAKVDYLAWAKGMVGQDMPIQTVEDSGGVWVIQND